MIEVALLEAVAPAGSRLAATPPPMPAAAVMATADFDLALAGISRAEQVGLTGNLVNRTAGDGLAARMGEAAGRFVLDVSDKRDQLKAEMPRLLQDIGKTGALDVDRQIKMLEYSVKMLESSTEVHLISSLGSSVEKNVKQLMQAQS